MLGIEHRARWVLYHPRLLDFWDREGLTILPKLVSNCQLSSLHLLSTEMCTIVSSCFFFVLLVVSVVFVEVITFHPLIFIGPIHRWGLFLDMLHISDLYIYLCGDAILSWNQVVLKWCCFLRGFIYFRLFNSTFQFLFSKTVGIVIRVVGSSWERINIIMTLVLLG